MAGWSAATFTFDRSTVPVAGAASVVVMLFPSREAGVGSGGSAGELRGQWGECGCGVEPSAVRIVEAPVPCGRAGSVPEVVEGAAEEQERVLLGVDGGVDDLADEDDVVAAVVLGPRPADQGGGVTGEGGCDPGVVPVRCDGLRPAGEMQCGGELVGREDVHGERRVGEVAARLRRPRQRHLAQPRLQRDGREGGDRGPVRGALGAGARDHRDPTGELAEDVAKCSLVHGETAFLHDVRLRVDPEREPTYDPDHTPSIRVAKGRSALRSGLGPGRIDRATRDRRHSTVLAWGVAHTPAQHQLGGLEGRMRAPESRGFTDWDEVHDVVSQAYFPHQLTLLGRGPAARTSLESTQLGASRLARIGFGVDVLIRSEHPGAYGINIPLTGHLVTAVGRDEVVSAPGLATVCPPGSRPSSPGGAVRARSSGSRSTATTCSARWTACSPAPAGGCPRSWICGPARGPTGCVSCVRSRTSRCGTTSCSAATRWPSSCAAPSRQPSCSPPRRTTATARPEHVRGPSRG
ncbi:hypothetical protein RHRU231_330141 [Rhodococcus ruber]|uniref:Transcription regulator HTH AraC- type ligand binding domain-containing protein n=1 Tax=Rhodococcus ruber TaxID=1830 RepID=A0A098BG38_9NOCA|nr:hypothetical protein RHRU231_330141 [Rhodococcus ruber]